MLSDTIMDACVHPKQFSRFIISAVFSVLLFAILAAGVIGAVVEFADFGLGLLAVIIFYGLLIAFVFWFGANIIYYNYVSNMIMVSDKNFPRSWGILEEVRREVGYPRKITMFVYESKHFNAWLMRLFLRRAIFLNSEILEEGVSDAEIRYIIGYFAGYLTYQRRAGIIGRIIFVAQHFFIFNLFIAAYHRAMVLSGDRLALMLIGGDINTAAMAMQKLFVGRTLGYSLNPVGIYEQRRMIKGSFFSFLARLGSFFPHAITRFVELVEFSRSNLPADFRKFEASNPGIPTDFIRR
jgi:Zn-dependent protease with chaperone function